MPSQKILLGLATYGRSFKLEDPDSNGLGAPASGAGDAGEYTLEAGFLSSYEICTMGLTVVEETEVEAPYGYTGDQWVGYDDETSLVLKVDNLIKEKNLLGAMFWTPDLDDFSGEFCGKGRYLNSFCSGKRPIFSCHRDCYDSSLRRDLILHPK